jgi:hypothetical protein
MTRLMNLKKEENHRVGKKIRLDEREGRGSKLNTGSNGCRWLRSADAHKNNHERGRKGKVLRKDKKRVGKT